MASRLLSLLSDGGRLFPDQACPSLDVFPCKSISKTSPCHFVAPSRSPPVPQSGWWGGVPSEAKVRRPRWHSSLSLLFGCMRESLCDKDESGSLLGLRARPEGERAASRFLHSLRAGAGRGAKPTPLGSLRPCFLQHCVHACLPADRILGTGQPDLGDSCRHQTRHTAVPARESAPCQGYEHAGQPGHPGFPHLRSQGHSPREHGAGQRGPKGQPEAKHWLRPPRFHW